MIKFKITKEEIAEAAISACLEYNKYKATYKDEDSHLENFFAGKIGEIAYSKHCGKPYNFEFYPLKGDGGMDFEGVQVKTVTWKGANKQLKVGCKSLYNPRVNKFVLMFFDPASGGFEASMVGVASKETLLKKGFKKEYYNKKGEKKESYTLNEKDLDHHY